MADCIEIDLSEARNAAEKIRDILLKLRSTYDLGRYEYTKTIRIAPQEIPHSHPVLTLNTMVRAEGPVLCTYLHEQMHWYATWYSYANHSGWRAIWQAIRQMFPSVRSSFRWARIRKRRRNCTSLPIGWK